MINKCYYGNDIHVAWTCINELYTLSKNVKYDAKIIYDSIIYNGIILVFSFYLLFLPVLKGISNISPVQIPVMSSFRIQRSRLVK